MLYYAALAAFIAMFVLAGSVMASTWIPDGSPGHRVVEALVGASFVIAIGAAMQMAWCALQMLR
jgi:hypothetical protein